MLALGVHKGDKVYLGDSPLEVIELRGYQYARVRVNGKEYDITDLEQTEVMPTVFVSCGKPMKEEIKLKNPLTGASLGTVEPQSRLNFNAPRSLRILRAKHYEFNRAVA